MTATFNGRDELLRRVGEPLGVTDWEPVRPEDIAAFGRATKALEPIHFDTPEAHGLFGGPVAPGYYTLSLSSHFLSELIDVHGLVGINYGVDRVRFPAPVPVGSRVRAAGRLVGAEPYGDGAMTRVELVYESDAGDDPVCVAVVVSLLLPDVASVVEARR